MIHDGEVKGLPLISYRDTKAAIEALTSAVEGMIAYATDTDELGYRAESAWEWITEGVGGSSSNLDNLDDVSIPVTPTDEDILIWSDSVSRWVNAAHFDVDDHTIYLLLLGRSGGQTLYGGTGASDRLTLEGTSHATVGAILLNPSGGSVGLGTTDVEAWAAAVAPTIESATASISLGASTGIYLTSNAYYDGDWKYKTTQAAANYYMYQGEHFWRIVASGTEDDVITWTNVMELSSDGYLGIGRPPTTLFDVYSAADNAVITVKTNKTNGIANFVLQNDAQAWSLATNSADQFQIRDASGGNNIVVLIKASPANSLTVNASGIGMGVAAGSVAANLHILDATGLTVILDTTLDSSETVLGFRIGNSPTGSIYSHGPNHASRADQFRFVNRVAGPVTLENDNGVLLYINAGGQIELGGGTSPATSALLDLDSTTGALLVPRMTAAQIGDLTPTNGMIVYQTDGTAGFYFYEKGSWVTGSGLT